MNTRFGKEPDKEMFTFIARKTIAEHKESADFQTWVEMAMHVAYQYGQASMLEEKGENYVSDK